MQRHISLIAGIILFCFGACAQQAVDKKQLKEYKLQGVGKELNTKGVKPEAVINTARNFLGIKHQMGGTSHKGLDCSGLVYVSFAKHNIQMPRSSAEQGRYGKQIAGINRLQRGDLVFFHMDWNPGKLVNHVGIYLGNNEFIHVSSSKGCVISSFNDQVWKKGFLFGTRVW